MKYYFLGIGGISMSAIALLLKNNGHGVAGMDSTKSKITTVLEKNGILVDYKDNFLHIDNSDVIVVSSAIPNEDASYSYAKNTGKKFLTRGEILGQISEDYKNVIAISGAHGKTTTTAIIGKIFTEAGLNPTIHIGGILQDEKSNLVIGDKEFFITEACEYKDNFLYLHPTFGVVLNVEAEHLDYFKTFENVKKSFQKFISQSKQYIAPEMFGLPNIKFSAKNYFEDVRGLSFDCYKEGVFYEHIISKMHGEHNIQNILSAIEVADYFGINKKYIQKAISSFNGVQRRFEKYTYKNGSTLIFDYAHHPTEVMKVINTVHKICEGKLIVLFQPHTYSRTKSFFQDFINCFELADRIIIFKTYSAREEYDKDGDAVRLYEHLKIKNNCEYCTDYSILDKLKNINNKDIVLVLGAGDFYENCNFFV